MSILDLQLARPNHYLENIAEPTLIISKRSGELPLLAAPTFIQPVCRCIQLNISTLKQIGYTLFDRAQRLLIAPGSTIKTHGCLSSLELNKNIIPTAYSVHVSN
jgi:hypothetical protein